jgi:hypothetical protein
LETLSEEENKVVLKVHPNILRLRIKHVLLLLTEDLDIVLSLSLFLFLNYLFKILFLLFAGHFLQSYGRLGNFVLYVTFFLFIFVVCHVVVRFFVLKIRLA